MAKEKKSSILVVDDHALVRAGLVQLIKLQRDLVCVGEAGSATSARKAVAARRPDVVLADLRLPDGDGLELIRELTSAHPSLRVLVISQFEETLYAERALKAGAHGYVMKESAMDEILTAIRTVLAGEFFASPKITALALHQLAGSRPNADGELANLTDRELQILHLIGTGMPSKKIAVRLCLSAKTVDSHRENIKHKLKLSNAAELARFAFNWLESQNRPAYLLENSRKS